MSRDSVWQIVREWKRQLRGLLRKFRGSLHDFLASGPSSREKYLDKFFLIGFLVTSLRLILVTKLRILRFKDNFFLNFQFSLVHFDCSLSCPFISLSQNHRVLSNKPPFSLSSLFQTSRKGMGFLFFSKHFMFIAFDFLVFELLLRFEKCDVVIWVGFILLSLLNGFC